MHKTSLQMKKPWLQQIKCGYKKEEYREYKDFYHSRFKKFVDTEEVIQVTLINGYKKDSPRLTVLCTVTIGMGNPCWGAPTDRPVYILQIRSII